MKNVPQPFYGYVHYFDPHWPYRPPGEDGECMVNNIKSIKRISRGQMMFKNPLDDEENELQEILGKTREPDIIDIESLKYLFRNAHDPLGPIVVAAARRALANGETPLKRRKREKSV